MSKKYTREEMLDIVKDIIDEQLGVKPEKVTEDSNFRDDLDADSLDLVELIMEFEEKFNAEIPDEDAQKIETVGSALDYMEAQQAKASSGKK